MLLVRYLVFQQNKRKSVLHEFCIHTTVIHIRGFNDMIALLMTPMDTKSKSLNKLLDLKCVSLFSVQNENHRLEKPSTLIPF
jgi:hypothetical protein